MEGGKQARVNFGKEGSMSRKGNETEPECVQKETGVMEKEKGV